jgi:shikimate kinase
MRGINVMGISAGLLVAVPRHSLFLGQVLGPDGWPAAIHMHMDRMTRPLNPVSYSVYTKNRLWLFCGNLTVQPVPRNTIAIPTPCGCQDQGPMPSADSKRSSPANDILEGQSIVLVGLMGAGKTSIGRLLAKRTGLEFIDADSEIEAAAGATIEEIFAQDGEAVFRSGERRVIARLLTEPTRVIATGGGAYMDADTRAAIAAKGVSIWLKANLETLLKRTQRRGGRPLLKEGDPREILARLIDERYPVYANADIMVETGKGGVNSVVERVVKAIEKHLGRGALTNTTQSKNDGGARRAPKSRRTGPRKSRNE